MLEAADLWLLRSLYAGGSSGALRAAISALTFLGSGWMLLGLVPVLFLRRLRMQSVALLVTIGVTSLAVASVKALAGRVRPCNALDWVHPVASGLPTDCSFPSGHAAGSFAFAVFIFAANRRAGLALLGVATAIAVSRVALGVHYPTDVAAGALLGSMVAAIGARLNAFFSASATVRLANADSEPFRQ